MPSQIVRVFVSYSHADASLVAPVVRLLRVNRSLVFQDTDQIPPGKKWRDEIARALAESQLVVIFWCDHASRSTEVSSEWKAAINQNKDLLPLLLDATPLPPELSQFQWIDFRGTVGATHASVDPSPSEEPRSTDAFHPQPSRRARLAIWPRLTAVAATAALVLFTLWGIRPDEAAAPADTPSVALPAPGENPPMSSPPSPAGAIGWLLPLLGVALASGAFFVWHRRSRRGYRPTAFPAPASSELRRRDVESRIAVAVEAEILRRTAT